MDLYAYMLKGEELIDKYIKENYGEIPRCRGVRFMKTENIWENDVDAQEEIDMHNKYVGTDTIYIHTRCGDCGMGYDEEDSNYVYCGAKKWEENNKDKFLEHITEEFDCTYCTHYFKAVINDDYKAIIKELEKGEENV